MQHAKSQICHSLLHLLRAEQFVLRMNKIEVVFFLVADFRIALINFINKNLK